MGKIIRRALSILPAVLLQALWAALLLHWLAPWAGLITMGLSVLALIFVLYIITKRDEGTYKILWLLVILSFPLPGALLYLLFGDKRTTWPLKKRLEAVRLPEGFADETETALARLAGQDGRMAATFGYLYRLTGCPVYLNREAVYYPLGDTLFPAMLDAMRQARRYIFLEYFIVEPGAMWDAMAGLLTQKAAEGVDVRMLYDDLGSLSTYTRANARALQKAGVRCVPFNPLRSIKGTLNYRDHRKMLIVDGEVAFSGGVNLADEYINRIAKHGHWKDIGLRLTGPAVQGYTRMFVQFWDAFGGEAVPSALVLPAAGKAADEAAAAPAGEPAAGVPAEGPAAGVSAEGPAAGGTAGAPADRPADKPLDGIVLSYFDSPLRPSAASNELYIELLAQATEYAWFFTPYLMPGDALQEAMARAARRGVDVRIIMPGIPDKKLVFRMSRSFYPVLLDAGVKIYEYLPGFVHAKGCVIDGRVGTVGTVNLDYRSLFLHFENNSLFYGASLLNDLKADFLATQAQCCRMELGKNVRLGFWSWTLDGVLRIFAPLC